MESVTVQGGTAAIFILEGNSPCTYKVHFVNNAFNGAVGGSGTGSGGSIDATAQAVVTAAAAALVSLVW